MKYIYYILLVIRMIFWLTVVKWKLRFTPFKKLAEEIGTPHFRPNLQRGLFPKPVRNIGNIMLKVKKIMPGKNLCLAQAYTVAKILRQHNVPYVVYFGVRLGDKGELLAHAWLNSSGRTVTGGYNKRKFKVIEYFGWEPPVDKL